MFRVQLDTNHPFKQVELVLRDTIVDDDDPGVLIDWDTDILGLFVAFANGGGFGVPPQPPWITTAVGGMSIATLTSDIVAYAAACGGGRTGRVLIAPNTQPQCCNVIAQFIYVQMHPFVQGCLNALPAAQPLATLSLISDKKIAAAVPVAVAPPPAEMIRAFL
jgi:hypothetical protein